MQEQRTQALESGSQGSDPSSATVGLLVALYLRVRHWYLPYRVIMGIKRIAT